MSAPSATPPMRPSRRGSDRARAASLLPIVDERLLAMLAADDIALAFQPQIKVATGVVVGVEALARAPDGIAPDALFARAAAASLGERLSRSVQHKALQAAGRWTGPLRDLRLSLNLLPEDLARPGYERWLLDEIAAAGLKPERITAEITESSLIADPVAAAARLACLRAAFSRRPSTFLEVLCRCGAVQPGGRER